MGNLLLGKKATTSNDVLPYIGNRALDGKVAAMNRWEFHTFPAYMTVDIGQPYWIDRWVVSSQEAAGWPAGGNYVLTDFGLQGSLDGKSWAQLASVSGNTRAICDLKITAGKYQYVRLQVLSGNSINKKIGSCVEFEVYEATQTNSFLSNLVVSTGTLNPAFSPTIQAYTVIVENEVTSLTVTPSATDIKSIMVNGAVVASGTASQSINLTVGTNQIQVVVTPKIGNPRVYTISVTRKATPWLTNLIVKDTAGNIIPLTPAFASQTLSYSAETSYDLSSTPDSFGVILTPTTDAGNTIEVNGVSVASGASSATIPLTVGQNTISVYVTSADGVTVKKYGISILRASNALLSSLIVAYGKQPLTLVPVFNKYTQTYTASLTTASATAVSVKPTAAATGASITVNNISVTSGGMTNVSVVSGSNVITIAVTPVTGTKKTSYVVTVTK